MTAVPAWTWIGSDRELAAAARVWRRRPALAIDTEFVRERTFFPRLGLVQVADGEGIWLVDPLALADPAPLREVLTDPEPLKVAHSCSEDIEALYHFLGVVPGPVFDTQVAAALAGGEPAASYQRLVAAELGVDVPKGQTRTDWTRRPLSDSQLEYAAHDVAFLLPLFARQREQLERLERFGWVLEDTARTAEVDRFLPAPESTYLRLRGAGRFSKRQLAVAQTLSAWREREARRRDLPRGFVLRDDAVLALAREMPRTAEELSALAQVPEPVRRRHGERLLALVEGAVAARNGAPDPIPQLPRDPAVQRSHDRLAALVRKRAESLGIAPPVLASRRDLKRLLVEVLEGRRDPPPPFDGWRWEVLPDGFHAELERLAATAASS